MHKHAEIRFVPIRATNCQLPFLYQLRHFQNTNLWYTLQTFFVQKRSLAHPCTFFNENESLQHGLSYDMRQMSTFLGLLFLGPEFRSGSSF